jgi:hypothetical protein
VVFRKPLDHCWGIPGAFRNCNRAGMLKKWSRNAQGAFRQCARAYPDGQT